MKIIKTEVGKTIHTIELTEDECGMIDLALRIAAGAQFGFDSTSLSSTILGFNVKEYSDKFSSLTGRVVRS